MTKMVNIEHVTELEKKIFFVLSRAEDKEETLSLPTGKYW